MTAAIRVLHVGADPSDRASVPTALGDDQGIVCVGTAASAGEAHERWTAAERAAFDVVLVDHQLPDEDGLSLCLWLTTRAPAPAVVILVPNPSAELALPAQVAGAARLVPSSCSAPEMRAAVRAAAAREPWHPAIPSRVARAQGERLAPEDLPILGMLRHGVAAAEIAATLGLTDKGLVARRWAMMEALTAPRAELRPARRLRPLRALSPSPVTG